MKLFGGYIAFIAALLIATIAMGGEYTRAWVVISLLALSLPSLVALILLDFMARVRQERPTSAMRRLAAALGFLPSLAAFVVLVGHFSMIAAVLFVILTFYWSVTIYAVATEGTTDPKSEV
jgi:hypothetical protein